LELFGIAANKGQWFLFVNLFNLINPFHRFFALDAAAERIGCVGAINNHAIVL